MTTYTPAYPYYKLPTELTKLDDVRVFNSGIVLEGMTQCAKDAYAHGITVAMGTGRVLSLLHADGHVA